MPECHYLTPLHFKGLSSAVSPQVNIVIIVVVGVTCNMLMNEAAAISIADTIIMILPSSVALCAV